MYTPAVRFFVLLLSYFSFLFFFHVKNNTISENAYPVPSSREQPDEIAVRHLGYSGISRGIISTIFRVPTSA